VYHELGNEVGFAVADGDEPDALNVGDDGIFAVARGMRSAVAVTGWPCSTPEQSKWRTMVRLLW